MLLPTRKLLLLLVIPAIVMLAWRDANGVAVGLAINLGIVLLAVFDWVLLPGRDQLTVARIGPAFLSLHAWNTVGWKLKNATTRPIRFWITEERPPSFEVDPIVVAGLLRGRATAEVSYRVRPQERGRHTLGTIDVRCESPFGLLVHQRRWPANATVKVYPNAKALARYEWGLRQQRLNQIGLLTTRERGQGTQFENLRDYLPGDDPAQIAWKATARRDKLIVREYGVERSQNVVLMLDCGRMMTQQFEGLSRLDHAINAAILLTYAAMKQGDSVGLLAFSHQIEAYLPPVRGAGALPKVNEALYHLQPQLTAVDYDQACRFLALRHRKRSLIITFTDVLDATASATLLAHMGRFARRHKALCVTLRDQDQVRLAAGRPTTTADCYRKAIASEALRRRAQALEVMRRQGVEVLDVEPKQLTPAVLNRYLELKRTVRL
jgi:uncharacterized protein (DUF58 family)